MRSRTGSRVSTTPTRPEPAAVRQPIRAVNSQEPLPAHPSRDWLLRGPPTRIKPTPKRPSTGEEPPQGSRLSGSRAANEASNCAVRDPRVVAAPGQQARRRRPHRCSRERSGPSDRTRGRSAARAGVLGGVAACRLRSAQVAATSCNYQPTPDRGSIGHPLGRAARDATARAASSRRGSPATLTKNQVAARSGFEQYADAFTADPGRHWRCDSTAPTASRLIQDGPAGAHRLEGVADWAPSAQRSKISPPPSGRTPTRGTGQCLVDNQYYPP